MSGGKQTVEEYAHHGRCCSKKEAWIYDPFVQSREPVAIDPKAAGGIKGDEWKNETDNVYVLDSQRKRSVQPVMEKYRRSFH